MKKRVKPKILIIDDEPDFCYLVKFNLENIGDYSVISSMDGSDGLRTIQREKPDLVLLDIMMPGMDGLEVLTAIKENPETADIPVVMLTALEQDKPKKLASASYANDYLPKPIKTEQLIATIFNTLKQRSEFQDGTGF